MRKLLLLLLVAAVLSLALHFDLGRYLSLDALKAQRGALEALQQARPLAFTLGFFAVYVLVTALSFPGAAVLTLAAGALFGLGWGSLLVSFASTAGATLAFLAARYLLRDSLQTRYGERLKAINAGVAREGAFYLFTLRLVPVFPFFLVNLVMGLTPIRTWTYVWVSQLGMLLGTAAYVNAGTELSQLSSLRGILSPGLIGAFALLGLLPLLARRLIEALKARQAYRGYRRPRRYDRNLIVIGAGAAGLVSSYIAAAVRAKVTLIEKGEMGGDCLNTGCVPSKALIRAARSASEARRAADFGVQLAAPTVDFPALMARVRRTVAEIAPHDSVARYQGLGVDCRQASARLVDPWTVELDSGERLTAPNIVLATGAAPFVPPIPGLAEAGYLSSDTLWNIQALPARLLVLGGGPIGCELAQAFARLGSQVTQVEMLPRLLIREDPEVSALVQARFAAEGIDLRLATRAKEVVVEDGEKLLICEREGREERIGFDQILVAVGRAARLDGTGLRELGLRLGKTIEVDDYGRTSFPNIYACGDASGPYQFTHTAAHTAWYAAVNALFGPLLWLRGGRFRIDYSVLPWVTFTAPEVARVGLNETEAREQGIAYEVARYGLDDLDRAIADGEAEGWVKVLTVPGKDRILGATVVGAHAGELLAEFTLAMRHGLGMNKLLGTIHVYPTWSEAAKYSAGVWKQAHKPEGLLKLVARYHDWRRG
ncbi:pyridine nucleotide-disulfide oxidoreductase [Stagnimonas aquatica]|uniref:Pyridine nucleotide-disulfide oxidoreductase n=1 Tax=Stagnimonas aquatica TaxID=2689987 RepID=A0A3N0V7R1_9GAMM|nr:FAD-dependent oxidoreductase [Stagnimonas aquatica]ROH88773.1 pyridine nucleotide-disulfide oxidoreductase [Stagnimonas aquatica]